MAYLIQQWNKGERITGAKLNHMEEGIEQAHASFEATDVEVDFNNSAIPILSLTGHTNKAVMPTTNLDRYGVIKLMYPTITMTTGTTSAPTISIAAQGVDSLTHTFDLATTEQYGMTKLSNAIDSTATTCAATPLAVKSIIDYLNITQITNTPGKTIASIDEINGKIQATFQDISISTSQITDALALGETDSTAYRGDRGKVAYDHAANKGSAFTSDLYKITTNAEGHVTAAVPVTLDDILALETEEEDAIGWKDITSSCTIASGVTNAKVLLNKPLKMGFFSCKGPANAAANTDLITLTPIGKLTYGQYYPNGIEIPEKTKTIKQVAASSTAVGSSGMFIVIDPILHTLTLNYKYGNNTVIDNTVIGDNYRTYEYEEYDAFNITPPALTHYTTSNVTGTMQEADIAREVIYTPIMHTLTVNYQVTDVPGGTNTPSAPATHTSQVAENGTYADSSYSVTSPTIPYFTPSIAVVSGTMGNDNVTREVTYSRNTHTLTINYEYEDHSSAAESYTATVGENLSYNVDSPTIENYTADVATVTGTMGEDNVTITVTYTAN